MNTVRGYSGPPKDFIFSLSEEICKETFDKLIRAYNELTPGDNLFIYISSVGGDVSFAEAIVDIINENCDKTFLVAHGEICSAAFDVFFKATCERKILPGTLGMAHFARVPIMIVRDDQSLDEWSTELRKWSKDDFQRRTSFYLELGFCKSEIKMLQNNKDVYFNEARLKVFLKNSIKLINARYK